jgi:hypothetical protein
MRCLPLVSTEGIFLLGKKALQEFDEKLFMIEIEKNQGINQMIVKLLLQDGDRYLPKLRKVVMLSY